MAHVVVVGGGIAGLAAAHALRRDAPAGTRVTLVEASRVLGGKLRTSDVAGVPVDEGAESFLVRAPEAVALAREIGLGDELVHPAPAPAGLWLGGRLRALPRGTVLGVPADLAALARAGVLSARGLARVPLDLLLPGEPTDGDVAVGALVARRLGREVVDRLVDPLLGGVYAGRADLLSLQASVPQLAEHAGRHTSLLRAARAASPPVRPAGPVAAPVFATVPGGLGRFVQAVAAAAAPAMLLGRPARELTRRQQGWRLVVGETRAAETIDADAVVLAVPAAPAARLLRDAAPAAAAELAAVDYASVAILTLAYRADPPATSGFLVPAVDGRLLKAATVASAKWPHLRGELTVVRGSVGRYGDTADLQRDDADLLAGAATELAAALGLPAKPAAGRVTRWGGALPQYAVGHRDRVRRILAGLPPGLAVAGAAYDGVGIAACIRSGQQAAARLLREWADG